MASTKNYGQFCGLARALDIVGERWTLLLVREMLLGPRRFSDLATWLPGLTPGLLTKRLKRMVEQQLITRIADPKDKRSVRYALTQRGLDLESCLLALGAWGRDYMKEGPAPGDIVNIGWGLISTKRRYTGGLNLIVELQFHGGRTFQQRLTPNYLELREDCPYEPQLTIQTDSASYMSCFSKGDNVAPLLDNGVWRVQVGAEFLAEWAKSFGLLFEAQDKI